jgi:branched-chain amino acid transport system ATP-binding protein
VTGTEIMRTKGVSKTYGHFTAVNEVDLTVREGEIHCIIGPNGAGKSTLFGLLSGEVRPSRGSISFRGVDVTHTSAWEGARLGMGRSFQVARLFNSFSVRESVRAAVLSERKRLWWVWRGAAGAGVEGQVDEILEEVGLADLSAKVANSLSQGDRKRLEVGMVLASAPSLFMFDEPTAGMSTAETEGTIQLILELRRTRNCSVLLTEHDMGVIFELADTLTVMDHGRTIMSGRPETVRDSAEVRSIYLGED